MKQREERAVRESERLGLIGRLTRPKRRPGPQCAQIEPRNPASGGYRGRHGLDAEDVERAAQIIGERGQAELGAHVGEAAHQEGALIHPLLDAAERVLDDLAAAVENRRPRFEALGHAIENVLVFEAENGAGVVRASRAQLASAAGFRVAVIGPFEIAHPAAADRRQQLPGRADVGVEPGVVSELVLAKQALAHRRAALRLGNVGNAAGLLAGLDVFDLEVAAIRDDVDRLDPRISRAGSEVSVSRPMSTTWFVTACSTISLFFASTAT